MMKKEKDVKTIINDNSHKKMPIQDIFASFQKLHFNIDEFWAYLFKYLLLSALYHKKMK